MRPTSAGGPATFGPHGIVSIAYFNVGGCEEGRARRRKETLIFLIARLIGTLCLSRPASPAKAAVGDKPVFAYIAGLPQPQRGIAEAVDALAAKTLPNLRRSVKWGMSYYGVGDGGASVAAVLPAMSSSCL